MRRVRPHTLAPGHRGSRDLGRRACRASVARWRVSRGRGPGQRRGASRDKSPPLHDPPARSSALDEPGAPRRARPRARSGGRQRRAQLGGAERLDPRRIRVSFDVSLVSAGPPRRGFPAVFVDHAWPRLFVALDVRRVRPRRAYRRLVAVALRGGALHTTSARDDAPVERRTARRPVVPVSLQPGGIATCSTSCAPRAATVFRRGTASSGCRGRRARSPAGRPASALASSAVVCIVTSLR